MSESAFINANGATIELRCGDSLLLLLEEDPRSIDVVVTSPPYNLGVKYRTYDDTISRKEYLEWCDRWLALLKDNVLANDGSLFLNMGGKPTDPTPPFDVLGVALRQGWVLQNWIHWVKAIALDTGDGRGDVTYGHAKPINSTKFLTDTVESVFHLTKSEDVENVFHLTKKGSVQLDKLAVGCAFADKSNLTRGNRGANGDRRDRGNAWFLPYPTIKSRADDRPHPASFPPELAERCYRLHGVERIRRTLDLFSGIGSSACGAVSAGVNHLGIELDELDHTEAFRRVTEHAESTQKAKATEQAWNEGAPLFDGKAVNP